MVRSTAIPLLILVDISLIPTEVGAAPITYYVVDYPDLQNGYTVSGTITTNGATGTFLPGTAITSWDILISLGPNPIASITPADSVNFSNGFNATPTTIFVSMPPESIIFEGITGVTTTVLMEWFQPSLGTFTQYTSGVNNVFLWSTALPTITSPIAVVPEPSSAVIAVSGAVTGIAIVLVRKRRAQRRQGNAGHTQPTE
jgi:hypothetical protein